ncbi:hypothetical protein HNQ07_000557 [Deinococcus metalli]|uniref:Alpha/beta hydrolase n=1 Tax=Deinococcus metalli TaxID=1141878 RepID=A0A7W8KDL3_9DEIO|nr:hypothetical protein [Deinococcus metalli]MBB5375113.1 hypothetical protein [Deinococcus metalli]
MPVLLRPAILLASLLWLSGCAPHWLVRDTRTAALDLAGRAPDVVILGVSGRCSPPCVAPRDNWDYLSSRGTLDAVADVYAAAGYRVEVAGFASHPAASHTSPYLPRPQSGYEALVAAVSRMRATWLRSGMPPRVVLVAHSHGVAWAHLLTRTFPEVAFTAQVDLDGMCVAWRSDYGAAVRALPPAAPDEPQLLDACDAVSITGRTVPLKDVVWPNVALNLEVQSKRLPARTSASGGLPVNYLFELARNTRLDGTATGIQHFLSVREDHSAISYPNSDALAWVTARLRDQMQAWPAPPAPAGSAQPASTVDPPAQEP